MAFTLALGWNGMGSFKCSVVGCQMTWKTKKRDAVRLDGSTKSTMFNISHSTCGNCPATPSGHRSTYTEVYQLLTKSSPTSDPRALIRGFHLKAQSGELAMYRACMWIPTPSDIDNHHIYSCFSLFVPSARKGTPIIPLPSPKPQFTPSHHHPEFQHT
ncbi:hypothetical protein CC86DRAFT_207327 [Ophiobolus disseminans]|uniref:Uncharacterized protein n=1 Tax=Ophiobolus disseminans TaxID=1469910 RepID=A0A6A7A6F3_9PLEO|nr:hypothetical protein CC86DRAFT_207327 [Ophiobolus disseminans]